MAVVFRKGFVEEARVIFPLEAEARKPISFWRLLRLASCKEASNSPGELLAEFGKGRRQSFTDRVSHAGNGN